MLTLKKVLSEWKMNISHFDFNFFKAKIYFETVIPLL